LVLSVLLDRHLYTTFLLPRVLLTQGLPLLHEPQGSSHLVPSAPLFPGTGASTITSAGQTLGGASHQQRNMDARTARLQALEQRQHVV
jgi:hypothetical protein